MATSPTRKRGAVPRIPSLARRASVVSRAIRAVPTGWQIVRNAQEMHAIGKNGCISVPVLSIIG